jgi:hypothetical protein
MPAIPAAPRAALAALFAVLAFGGLSSCSPGGAPKEQAQVAQAFDSWKSAVINQQTAQAMIYIPQHVDDYLNTLNATAGTSAAVPASTVSSQSPDVDQLLRTALVRKVPPNLRAKLTLAVLWQRITERHLFNPRDVRQIHLGRVSVTGDHAEAELYYQETLSAVRLPFVKEGNVWKIDVMATLPYAELLMRVDRAIKGETASQQVDQLVNRLPSL